MTKRTSAISHIKNIHEWKTFNPVFDLNTSQFDKAFSSEYGLDPDYYLLHTGYGDNSSFEERMVNNLFSGHGNPDSKLYLLRGDLGVGKTTFVHYMGSYLLPKTFDKVFFMYVNCYNRFPRGNTSYQNFDKVFLRMFKETLINNKQKKEWQYSTEACLAQAVLNYRGVYNESDLNAIRELNNSGADVLLPFLLQNFRFDRIFIAIDNMDDCSEDVREIGFSFAQSLSDIVMECGLTQANMVSILVPLRRYTNFSTDTEGYPRIDMPTHSTSNIMTIKIEHVKDLINNNYIKGIKEYISHTTFRKREVTKKDGTKKVYWERYYSGKWVSISNISMLFKTFIKKTEIRKKHGLLDFVENMSGGNLKLVTRNTYNIFHSCKLNISDIMQFVYTPEDSYDYKKLLEGLESSSFGAPIIYDLTMAIHYPFYDFEASCIANMFNIINSTAPNDWRNTLCMTRFLLFLYNNGPSSYEDVQSALESIGYNEIYYKKALEESLNYCLLKTNLGTKLEHLSNDTTLELSTAGKYMIDFSICDHRYLGYVCENTMMEPEFIVKIEDKYQIGKSTGNIHAIDEGVKKFYSFLKKEESKEIEYVTKIKKWHFNSFLRDFSPLLNGSHVTLSEYIKIRVAEVSSIELE